MKKKSQAWGIDLIIAITIFLTGIIIFYFYSINSSEELKSLSYDGNNIASSILSEGYPALWNTENVEKIGILSNGKINETKLENFYLLASSSYNKTKMLLNTRSEYYFFLAEPILINSSFIDGVGKPGINRSNIPAKNLIKLTRMSIYKNNPKTVYFYIWQE